jgi:hypothetical protein
MVVRDGRGAVRETRSADNIVVRAGARLVAGRMVGLADVEPINLIRLGFARESADPESTALTPPDPPVDAAALESAVPTESFSLADDLDGVVRISVAAEFEPTVDLEGVTEAGLFAGDQLYNQVVFEPVTLREGQRVTFFWDIDIPFGD